VQHVGWAAQPPPYKFRKYILQGDQKVSLHQIITIQKVTSNVQSVPRQSPDIY